MTMTTYDEELCKVLEPNVCTTKRRAEVLNIMKEEGIPTICWLTPILPYINDTPENIQGILDYCIQAKVYGILFFDIGVTLRDGDRQYFYHKLDQHFKGLKQTYMKEFGNAYEVPSPNRRNLIKLLQCESKKNGIVCDSQQLFEYMHSYEDKQAGIQLSLCEMERN